MIKMADGRTKAEYLVSLQEKAKKIGDIRLHGTKRLIINGVKLLVVFVIVTGIGTVISSMQENDAAKAFQNNGELSFEFLYHDGIFSQWNAESIGNDINTLLTGGKILVRDGVRVTGATVVKPDDGFLIIQNASYLNKIGDFIIYRDDKDRHIYMVNLVTRQKTVLYAGNSGEVLCTKDNIYFIDYDCNSNIMKLSLDGNAPKKVMVNKFVTSFAVCGDTIIYIDSKQDLCSQKINGQSHKTLMSNVERFYINGNIIAESKNKVVSFRPNGNKAQMLYEDSDKEMQLAGIIGNHLFIESKGAFLVVNGGKPTTLNIPQGRMYGSIVKDGVNNYYGICYENNDDNKLILRLVKIEGVQ